MEAITVLLVAVEWNVSTGEVEDCIDFENIHRACPTLTVRWDLHQLTNFCLKPLIRHRV